MTAAALPVPSFVDRDPTTLTLQLIARFETITGRTLEPAQAERLLIDLIAYESQLLRNAIQQTGLQALVAFAGYPSLDFLAELVGVARLAAVPARTTLMFTLTGVQGAPVTVPAGTRVATADGQFTFATLADYMILAGDLSGSTDAVATVTGAGGNGYVAGQIATSIDAVPNVGAAVNAVTSFEGADNESDDALRERVRGAVSAFSSAGPVGAYRAHAMAVSAAVLDAVVSSPAPGVVRVAVLSTTGAPSTDLLDAITAALNDQYVRPLTDTVEVVAPDTIAYTIAATITRFTSADLASVQAAVTAAATAYATSRRQGLGRDVVRSQLVAALQCAGVYSVTLTAPASDVPVSDQAFADCTAITITMTAPVEG